MNTRDLNKVPGVPWGRFEKNLLFNHVSEEEYIDKEYIKYENYLEFQLGLILWSEPHRCMQKQIEYLKSQITKPYGWTVLDEVMQRIDYMQLALKFLPPRSKHGQGPKQVKDWNPSIRTMSEQTLRKNPISLHA